jgi:hypothetical protein
MIDRQFTLAFDWYSIVSVYLYTSIQFYLKLSVSGMMFTVDNRQLALIISVQVFNNM